MKPHPIVAAILLLATPAMAADITGVPRILDGDTIQIEGTKIRLRGIDAPEKVQVCLDPAGETWACGVTARDELLEHVGDRPWTCHIERHRLVPAQPGYMRGRWRGHPAMDGSIRLGIVVRPLLTCL